MIRKSSFAPVVDANTRVLVLGSLPGEASLAAARYYAHPQNAFWRLMGVVLGEDLAALDYESRLAALLRRHVGLWDVISEAVRQGSLDAAIRAPKANDLRSLVDSLPNLRAIAFNGGAAAKIGTRSLTGEHERKLIALPSSSPAYTLPFEEKAAVWRQLGDHLSAARA